MEKLSIFDNKLSIKSGKIEKSGKYKIQSRVLFNAVVQIKDYKRSKFYKEYVLVVSCLKVILRKQKRNLTKNLKNNLSCVQIKKPDSAV